MTIFQTSELTSTSRLSNSENHQLYCGLDSCITLEVFEELSTTLPAGPPAIYSFERALQAPYLEIMLRGFAIDEAARRHASEGLRLRREQLQETLNELARAVWDRPLNPRSHTQLKDFFYSAMKLPEVWLSQKGVRKLSLNREALEKLESYLYARPLIYSILAIRDLSKQIEVLETAIDPDGRYRTSYNIAGTETGRPSSSENAFGTGGNAQNIAPGLRYVFVADPGWKLCNIDLEQVEARDVGWFCGVLFNDWDFLDACESGDLHTNNAKRVWPERPWTGEPKADRQLADEIFYRDFTYRDMAKRGSHLSNYMGTAWTMARSLKIPQVLADDFQARYCRGPSCAFPAISRWWDWTRLRLQTTHHFVTPFGRERHFFGRPDDDSTLREAIAFQPQSTTADRMNLGLWRVWKKMPQVQLLGQGFDSIQFQYRECGAEAEAQIILQALELIQVELVAANGRQFVVPGEAAIGWNWGKAHDARRPTGSGNRFNPEGLVKWSPGKPDQRVRPTGLQRRILTNSTGGR